MKRDVIIIGGGASGLAAAISVKEEGRDVLLIEREEELGGILNQCIHNGFGLEMFKEEYTGPEYANIYITRFMENNIDYLLNTTVTFINKIGDDFEVTISSTKLGIKTLLTKSVIISTGCYERTRGSIMIPGKRPYGIITAGSAQRYLNIDGYMVGKKVFILGSGDIGLIMARRMNLEGATVLGVAELMPYSNGLTRNIVQCLNDFDIPLYLSYTVIDVETDEKKRLKSITISKVDKFFKPIKGTEKVFEVDTLLLSIGLIPDITLLDNLNIKTDLKTKSAKVNQAYETSVPGLFICGNALQVHDLADNVSKESERAGKFASKYLEKKLGNSKNIINVKPGNNINYVAPQNIDLNWNIDDILLSFRSTKKIEKGLLKVTQNNELIYKKRLMFIVPAEMQSLIINKDILNGKTDINLDLEVLL